MPGALPAINRRAVEATVLTGLALGCAISPYSKFDRKNYSYPDLPKGYQITQYDLPLCSKGVLEFHVDGKLERCAIVRVHLEEDTGKSIHTSVGQRDVSLVDYNRSGVPLMEIVGDPDLTSPMAAREYFASLRQILMYLGVCDGNLQAGSMRADVNVSLRNPDGSFGTKVEIKNLNSFRAVQRSLDFEIDRQRRELAAGGAVEQETRGWSEKLEITVPQRSKEYAHDYRYFPEPDLPPIVLTRDWLERVRASMGELPMAKRRRFHEQYGLSPQIAAVLTDDLALADFFEQTVTAASNNEPAEVAKWITGEVLKLLNESSLSISDARLAPRNLGTLVTLVRGGTLSAGSAKTVLEEIFHSGEDAEAAIERLDLRQINNRAELMTLIAGAVRDNAAIVEQYRSGQTKAFQALMGKAMGAAQGRADPKQIADLLRASLDDV